MTSLFDLLCRLTCPICDWPWLSCRSTRGGQIRRRDCSGEQIGDAYLTRLRREVAKKRGAIFVGECDGVFAGFAVGWIVERDHIPESADSNRFGYLSDICVMPAYRRQRVAQRLLAALERHFASAGITRFRLFTLAPNASTRAAYQSAGFAAYEILYEKLVGRQETAHP